ncbi:DNA/RNA helicase domain-containing protein [Nocardioides zeae]|uniref:DNA/RNA helicase domain-containing protein n=1 Tax=Nocardioides imazamoxiresistens TaxID=3231893 RepID=A0ABU3PUU6_9ACTN|nr:DNA/RNA helicase domain-containing protein [Nocardioides zeae]MDT9592991.1 DNA/RNA helicase domain-containing protein [Nocardioides zeae]
MTSHVGEALGMTSFRIEEVTFRAAEVSAWSRLEPRFRNWPVVYTLSDGRDIYVGESLNAAGRFKQHLESPGRRHLRAARVVVDDTFNKSVCLDLESYLIRLFAGDGKYQVLNGNHGITNADYFGRDAYRTTFGEIFEALRDRGAFTRPIQEIENSDLFKLSPFKALTQEQAIAVEDILSGLFDDLESGAGSRIVISGSPGTGKTVVAIFLMKLLSDIQHADPAAPPETDALLAEFFVPGYPELLRNFRVGLVVPQQSLRTSIKGVFKKTPGLRPAQVLSPFEVGNSPHPFDLLVVDETHRLNQRAAQAAGPLNTMFAAINRRLFGSDDPTRTQLDWINVQSKHQIYLLDGAQAIRPADLPLAATTRLREDAAMDRRLYRLTSQMRVRAGDDYVAYIRGLLDGSVTEPKSFGDYDLRFFDDFSEMRRAIFARDAEVGLSRVLAGFAWKYASKKDRSAVDIRLGGLDLQWNGTDVDWVSSPGSLQQVGSIHTIQGYDLNYAGVVVGRDLRFDQQQRRVVFDRSQYFDPRGTTNNKLLGITYSDDDILALVRNIYAVLLTRGMSGTYVYVCDEALRSHLRPFFSSPRR